MLQKQVEVIRRIHFLIRKGRTGTPEELSKKIGIPIRTLYRYFEFLKELGAPVKFVRGKNTFVYQKSCRVDIRCQVTVFSEDKSDDQSKKRRNDNKKGKSRRST